MIENTITESVDYNKLTQLARYGLVDKSNVQKLIAAFKKMEDGKALQPAQRELMLSVLTDLTSIVTGDSQMFMKAKKAVSEDALIDEKYDTPVKKKPVSMMSKAEKDKNDERRKSYKEFQKSLRKEDTQIDEISMTKMAAYAPKAVKSRNDAKAATHSADSNRVANAKKVIAKRKAGADNYNKKMWGYGNVAPTKESVEQDSYEKTKQKTMKTFPNVKHFTKSGHPDWKKHGITNIPTKESIDAKNIDAALVTQRKRLKFDTIMAKQATQHKKEKMARADGAAYRGRTEDTQIDEMGAFMSSPLPTPMSMRKEPSMTKPLMLTKKMNTAATLIKKAGNTPVSPRTEATYSDTGWQKPEVKKDQSGNVIKTKNVAKTLAKSGLRRTKDLEAAQKAKYLTFSKVKK